MEKLEKSGNSGLKKFTPKPEVRRRVMQVKILQSAGDFFSGATFKCDYLSVLERNVVLKAVHTGETSHVPANRLRPRGPRSRSNDSRLDFDYALQCSEDIRTPIKVPFCPGQAREIERRPKECSGPQEQADPHHLQAKEYIIQ